MEDMDAIMVARPVYNRFQVILTETHLTTNSLMEHFFQLYKSSIDQISEEKADTNVICGRMGDNCSKLIVNIPKSLLRRNISVNVNLPHNDQCTSGDNDDSSEDSSSAEAMCNCNRVTDKTTCKNIELSHSSPLQEPIASSVANSSVKDSPNTTLSQTYNCNFCTFKTKGLRKFKNHIRKHSIKQLNCQFCEKIFLDQSKLDQHVKTRHVNSNMHAGNAYLHDEESVMEGHNGTKVLSEKKSQVLFETQNIAGEDSNSSQVKETEGNALLTSGHQFENKEVKCKGEDFMRGDNLSNFLQIKTSNGVLYKDFHVLENEHEKNYFGEYHTKSVTRKRVTCRLCEVNFANVNLYNNHRIKCCRMCFICNCNMKFKWKSVFLHHKANCTASKLTNLTRRNKKFVKLWNGRKCSKNTHKKLDSVFTEMLKPKPLCIPNGTHGLKSKECNSVTMEVDKIIQNTHEEKITWEEHKKEDDSCQHKKGSSITEIRGKSIQKIPVSSPLHPSELNSLRSQEVSKTKLTNSAVCSMQLPENENMTGCNITASQNGIMSDNNNSSKMIVDSWKLNSFLGSPHDKEIDQCRQESTFALETGVDFVKQEPMEADDNFSALLQNGEHLSVEKLIEAASFREFSHKSKLNTDADFQNVLNSLSGIDDGDVNLKCEECGESFKRKAYLKEHIEGKHGGGLRYSCECGKRFKWRSSLGSHRKNCYHGYQTMLSLLPEGQNQGQSVSVIDFTKFSLPYMSMQHEWIQEMQKLTEASTLKGNDSQGIFRQDNRQRHLTSPERPKGDDQVQTHKRKSESVNRNHAVNENNSTLRIDTSLVKPFVDALAKYQQKPATNILTSNNMASKLGHYNKRFDTEQKSTATTEQTKLKPNTGVIDLSVEHSLNKKNSPSSQNTEYITNVSGHDGNTTPITVNNRSHLVEKARTGARAKSSDFIQTKQVHLQQRRKSHNFAYTETLECSFCKETFYNEDELERHKLYCIHLQDTCSVCGKTFQHRTDLVTHLLTCHGSDEAYTCFCEFTSSNWNSFEKHCERCEDFKMQSSSFSTNDKNKKNKSESRSFTDRQHSEENTPLIKESVSDERLPGNQPLKVNQLNQKLNIQAKPIYNQHFQDDENSQGQDLSLQAISRSSTNHFPIDNFMEVQSTVRQYNNGTQVTKPMTNMNILPTISSFVTPSTGNLEHFSNTAEKNQPSNEQSRSNIDQSKPRDIELVKNDVFVCTFCGNVYNSLEKFSQHNKIHHPHHTMSPENEKKSAVDIAINKARHLTDKIPDHVCHLCGDVFAAKAYLKEHISGKHGAVDRYKCPCGMRFKWRSSLGIHQKKCPSSSKRTYNRWTSGLDNNDVDIFKSDLQNVNQSVV